jgi:hypothetical protein
MYRPASRQATGAGESCPTQGARSVIAALGGAALTRRSSLSRPASARGGALARSGALTHRSEACPTPTRDVSN